MKYLAIYKDKIMLGKNLDDLFNRLKEENIDINLCDLYELQPIKIDNKTITYKNKE